MTVERYLTETKLPEGYIDLYIRSFPDEERRDWQTNEDAERFISSHPEMRVLLAFSPEGEFVGFLNYWLLSDSGDEAQEVFYGEHLAIKPEMRNQGIGANIIAELKRLTSDRILMEVELPEDEMACRRIAMYERHGFVTHPDIKYLQPSYAPGKEPIELMLMSSPCVHPTQALIARLKRLVYNA